MLFAEQLNITAVGHQMTAQQLHGGRLAGAVFTQKGENFTGLHIQVYVVVGYHAAEGFAGIWFFRERCMWSASRGLRKAAKTVNSTLSRI